LPYQGCRGWPYFVEFFFILLFLPNFIPSVHIIFFNIKFESIFWEPWFNRCASETQIIQRVVDFFVQFTSWTQMIQIMNWWNRLFQVQRFQLSIIPCWTKTCGPTHCFIKTADFIVCWTSYAFTN
jgi:hypothetical protein